MYFLDTSNYNEGVIYCIILIDYVISFYNYSGLTYLFICELFHSNRTIDIYVFIFSCLGIPSLYVFDMNLLRFVMDFVISS